MRIRGDPSRLLSFRESVYFDDTPWLVYGYLLRYLLGEAGASTNVDSSCGRQSGWCGTWNNRLRGQEAGLVSQAVVGGVEMSVVVANATADRVTTIGIPRVSV